MSSALCSLAPFSTVNSSAGLVLLVEDEEYIAHLLEIAFTREGFSFLWARSGAEAISYVEEHRDRVTLALVDWNLPDITGGDLSRELRALLPGLPLLLTSGLRVELDEDLDAGGPTVFLAKPFLPSRLLAHVQALLRSAVAA